MDAPDLDSVLLIGVYGSGQSSVAAEVADLVEMHRVPYAAVGLDWLAWANIEDSHGEPRRRLLLANLARPYLPTFALWACGASSADVFLPLFENRLVRFGATGRPNAT
jgi:hypothetical protein